MVSNKKIEMELTLEAKATMVYWWSWDKKTLQEDSNYYVFPMAMPRKKATIAWKRGVMHKKKYPQQAHKTYSSSSPM
jgi:hypothetical protein